MSILHSVYTIYKNSKGVNTDSRTLEEGQIFVALKGDNFNGNEYVEQAINAGAAAVIYDEPQDFKHHNLFQVEDSLSFLQQLANHHRNNLSATFIGITGSNGKTTTKELIRDVLATTHKTQATIGNFNNHIGVPLTLLSLQEDVEIAIIEMGANHQKEIEFLCNIAEPDFGYITNFGKAHLEGFGGVEGVIKGKSELYDYLKGSGKKVLVNGNDPIQVRQSKGISSITFGEGKEFNITIENKSTEYVSLEYKDTTIKTQLIGDYNADNAKAALAFGKIFEVPLGNIKLALESYIPEMNRSQILKTSSNTLILDAYNANPTSMEASIGNFKKLKPNNKLMILGDMFEMGEFAKEEHKKIIDFVEKSNITAIFIGEEFYNNKNSNNTYCKNTAEAKELILKNPPMDSTILLKGSRGMKLESLKDIL